MKHIAKLKYMALGLIMLGTVACEEELPVYNNPNNMLNFDFVIYKSDPPKKETPYSFAFVNSAYEYDTIWVDIKSVGFPSDKDRPLALEQVPSGQVDAQPGVHYVPFDSPELAKYYIMPANEVKTKIPIIFKKDPSMQSEVYRLYVTFKDNGYFRAGYEQYSIKRLTITDQLVRPSQWDSYMEYYFNVYNPVLHKLLIDATGLPWDDPFIFELFRGNRDENYINYLRLLCKEKLAAINKERAEKNLGPLSYTTESGVEEPVTFNY